MAYDKVVDSTVLDNGLTAIAGAVRTKGGTSAALSFPTGIVNAINALPSGGGGVYKLDLAQDNFSVQSGNIYIDFPTGTDISKIVTIHVPVNLTYSYNTQTYSVTGTFDIIGTPTIGDGLQPGLATSLTYKLTNRGGNQFSFMVLSHTIGTAPGTGLPRLTLTFTTGFTFSQIIVDSTHNPYIVTTQDTSNLSNASSGGDSGGGDSGGGGGGRPGGSFQL